MIAAEMLCVVETGIPKCVARPIIEAEVVSAAKPFTACNFTNLCPKVLMILQQGIDPGESRHRREFGYRVPGLAGRVEACESVPEPVGLVERHR